MYESDSHVNVFKSCQWLFSFDEKLLFILLKDDSWKSMEKIQYIDTLDPQKAHIQKLGFYNKVLQKVIHEWIQ